MSPTDKLAELVRLCKCGVHVSVNPHRDVYQTVKEHLADLDALGVADIDDDMRERMIVTDTIVTVDAYPDTPIGSYKVQHYDLDGALGAALEAVQEDRRNG